MAGRINQSRVKTKQIPYEMREKDATVFAVAIRVIKSLLGEKSPVASPHLVVKLIDQRRLYPVEQPVGGFQQGQAVEFLFQCRIEAAFQIFVKRRIGICGPSGHEIIVDIRGGISVVKIHQILVDLHIGAQTRRRKLPRLREVDTQLHRLLYEQRQSPFVRECNF